MNLKSAETPCIGICSTIYGDEICRGCFRYMHEVVDWNAYPAEQKLTILKRLNQQITQLVSQKLIVFDPLLLKAKCQHHRIKIREEFTPYTWAHALLREGLHDIKDIQKYGISIQPEFKQLSLARLIELIDDELFNQASA